MAMVQLRYISICAQCVVEWFLIHAVVLCLLFILEHPEGVQDCHVRVSTLAMCHGLPRGRTTGASLHGVVRSIAYAFMGSAAEPSGVLITPRSFGIYPFCLPPHLAISWSVPPSPRLFCCGVIVPELHLVSAPFVAARYVDAVAANQYSV